METTKCCVICGNPFEPRQHNQRFCSEECRKKKNRIYMNECHRRKRESRGWIRYYQGGLGRIGRSYGVALTTRVDLRQAEIHNLIAQARAGDQQAVERLEVEFGIKYTYYPEGRKVEPAKDVKYWRQRTNIDKMLDQLEAQRIMLSRSYSYESERVKELRF